jgi:protein TonB
MFETAVIQPQNSRSLWGFAGSIALQGTLLSGALIAGIYMPIMLPAVPDIQITPPAPRIPPSVRIVGTIIERARIPNALNPPFRRIFRFHPQSTPAPTAPSVAEFSDVPTFVGGGTLSDGIPGAIPTDSVLTIPVPPKPPTPPTPPAQDPVRRITIGGNVLEASILDRAILEFPQLARQTRTEGTVELIGVISTDGRVTHLRVLSGHPLLVRAALAAVSQWRYRPTLLNGQPVEVEAPITVNFRLSR